ncbi:MAG TPA: hypothetical protein VEC19_07470 [Usitatibacter sp.]|nr:hypothetical protein [Usitatibacter sp.]
MLFASGLVLLVLGLFCGVVLVLAPLGLIDATAGWTLWILFPVFSIGGYLLAAAPSENKNLHLLSRISGVFLLLLALAAGIALVLQGIAMIETKAGTFSLWYVLVVGLVLGGTGVASHRAMANT